MATQERARRLIDAQLGAAGWLIQDRGEMKLGGGLIVRNRRKIATAAIMGDLPPPPGS